ncbi:glycoside hydrolase family 47 protein [Parathielavia hyrcaniae]|uniref:alpha-1,2-Mannosidase n=1 Tax=Parathielavia hyrcaniae TaxID=113614 RepID=A0AAN6Q2H7_9PEZI|nr:glycoside hydrolase family 47 protein [Parathielavia hyrcaniae]
MLTAYRRFQRLTLVAALFLAAYFILSQTNFASRNIEWRNWKYTPTSFDWRNRPQSHPVDESTMTRLPEGKPRQLPTIQHIFSHDELTEAHNKTQRERRDAVRTAARRSWRTYRNHAWGRDEVAPQQLVGKDTFSGWGATLVDALDTLSIMGMEEDFRDAVRHVASIDWNNATSGQCSLFETNIRYLGGLLSAYDLSQERVLLDKAIELGDMLHAGFDTPNHMPANSFHFKSAKEGKLGVSRHESSAAAGSLSLEFTRLSQLTGDPKYYHAIDGVKKALERTQNKTSLPGMWPVFVDLRNDFFTPGTSFSLGASADSAYEYLSKMHALLGGLDPAYERLHTRAMATAQKHVLFRPMLPDFSPTPTPDILFSGTVLSNGNIVELRPEVQHLGCFAGGMFALGGRLFGREDHVRIGEQLARGCAWAYDSFPTGIMPEVSAIIPCEEVESEEEEEDNLAPCAWNETRWREHGERVVHLPKPFSAVLDPRYMLRPEAIESVFVLYRVTGQADLLDTAWRMFESITRGTRTRFAHSAITDVLTTGYTTKTDEMESFWLAETLKYFYLVFSEPELISLDDYVFNTEAHPLRLPKPV